jgi:protein gp37
MAVEWPLPNVWLGVTAENQRFADERIPTLLETPAAVRFVSLEPLLGPIDLRDWELSWAIVGGESGGPKDRALVERRDWPEPRFDSTGREIPQPMLPGSNGWWPKEGVSGWVRSLRDQCVAAGVPFLFKQWGGPRPKSAGRMLDGRTWDEYPA